MDVPEHLHEARRNRLDLRARRDAAINALYPHARTFVAVNLHAVDDRQSGALADVPRTLTLVTPDVTDPSRDHLFVGPHPVLRRDLRWDAEFDDLTFKTTVEGQRIHGHLRLSHSRTRAFGSLHVGGLDLAVEYALAPQRYVMKMGKNAAWVNSASNKIMFDPASKEWRDAQWQPDVLGFRFGPIGLGRMDDTDSMELLAQFDYIPAGTVWRPSVAESTCRIDGNAQLVFELMRGARPIPSSPDTNDFPYQLRIQFTPFGETFDGGLLTTANNAQHGVPYGVQGVWDGGSIAGLYRLNGLGVPAVIGVHNRELYAGAQLVPGTTVAGNRLSWSGLAPELAAATGLPVSGHLEFSADGSTVVGSSFGASGHRVSPDEVVRARPRVAAGPPYTLTDLINMTQFATDARGMYFDEIQQQSMGDFYLIMQHYMDPDLRRKFLSVKPPVLSQAVENISRRPGDKGTDPRTWYHSMGTAYVAQTLSKWSDDPAATLLNGVRAGTYLTEQSEFSDVMAVQSPLLYQNRYVEKYPHKVDWFLLDQRDEAKQPVFRAEIDAEIGRLQQQVRDEAGTPEEKAKIIRQLDDFGTAVKQKRLYWAFKLYAYALRPAYVNMLQSIIEDPTYDGSMFTQQVQRTVAQLNALDASNTVAAEYARLLQLFQLGNLLPQLADYSGDLEKFNFAVKQIVDSFVATYLNSEDPALRLAADQLSKDGTIHNIGILLDCLRAAASVSFGLYSWDLVAERFATLARQRLGTLPGYVANGILLAAVGLMIGFAITGQIGWEDLPEVDRILIISMGAGVVATGAVYLIRRGVAVGALFVPGQGFGQSLKTFFGFNTLTRAETSLATGFRGWLLNTPWGDRLGMLQGKQQFALAGGRAADAAKYGRKIAGQKALNFVFGRNMREFVATRIGAAVAAGGIIMAAIALHNGGEPIEVAVNALFLVASTLELIATVGAWGLAYAGVTTIGGMAVGSILAAVSIVGLVVLIAGFVLMVVMMFRPEPSPVEKFAESAGPFYMPFKAAIDSFEVYQPLSQPQRTGIAVHTGSLDHTMVIHTDGSVGRGKVNYSGHTAFYSQVDQKGRVQIAAPIRDAANASVFFALSTDESGKVKTTNAVADNAAQDPKLLWIAEIQGPGTYEKTGTDGQKLHSAPFRLSSAYWADRGERRYLVPDAGSGWRLSTEPGPALTIEMVPMEPRGLQAADITWFTYQHDERRSPALDSPGSEPRTWSISPALPTGIELVTATGEIAMVRGATIAPLAPTRYRLTVANAIGSASVEFTLEVKVSADRSAELVGSLAG